MSKPKVINFELIDKLQCPAIYAVLDKMRFHHRELADAYIALAWRKALTPDKDGHLVLGKCMKISDMHKELADYDFVILLNQEAWADLSPSQREALVDHELCHAASTFDEDGNRKMDERGRPVWRTRKHDIEEFQEIVTRHGCYKRDLERFAEECAKSRNAPLFTEPPTPELPGALAAASGLGGTHQKRKPRDVN